MTDNSSTPLGTWYLKTWYHDSSDPRRLLDITLTIRRGSGTGSTYDGSLVNEEGISERIDQIRWNENDRRFIFRSHKAISGSGSAIWRWFNGKIVEGIVVGRFSQSDRPDEPMFGSSAYANHFNGWNAQYIDGNDIVPRVYTIFIDGNYRGIPGRQCRGLLRIDRIRRRRFIGTMKVYATGRGLPWEIAAWDHRPSSLIHESHGEELEYDLDITEWNGTDLHFIRRDPVAGWTQEFRGRVNGRTISGTFTHSTLPGQFPWNGFRAQVLTYGLVRKSNRNRRIWQERTRRQLQHLIMAGNPIPNTTFRSEAGELPTDTFVSVRDDNPRAHPQRYTISDIWLDHTIQNPYGGPTIVRRSHAKLCVPTKASPSGRRYPALIAVNGHSGSAWRMLHPQPGIWFEPIYWYADSFARRGFVVLAVDISHRDDSLLYGPPCDWWAPREHHFCDDPSTPPYPGGDDPDHGNGPHHSIKSPQFDTTDWEEDGERAWDVIHALDYLLNLNYVNPKCVLITGLSMGGEITTIAGALDPRFSIVMPAGWSPDAGVFYHCNAFLPPPHTCGNWVYADNLEYVDISDYHALVAPRPLIVQTGKLDDIYSKFTPLFAGDKAVARRSRIAYERTDVDKFIHYLHYDGHAYHVGETSSDDTMFYENNVRVPSIIKPQKPGSLGWQTDPRTVNTGKTLFDYIKRLGCSSKSNARAMHHSSSAAPTHNPKRRESVKDTETKSKKPRLKKRS